MNLVKIVGGTEARITDYPSHSNVVRQINNVLFTNIQNCLPMNSSADLHKTHFTTKTMLITINKPATNQITIYHGTVAVS